MAQARVNEWGAVRAVRRHMCGHTQLQLNCNDHCAMLF